METDAHALALARGPAFATVALDVDSTLSGIEGIDWLAARRGGSLAGQVAALTEAAMAGMVAIEDVYAARVKAIAPSATEVAALSDAYRAAVAPDAQACIAALHAAGVRILLVSGGFREAILPLCRSVGINDDDLYAVGIRFDGTGAFAGFDADSQLTRGGGKARLLDSLGSAIPKPILHVGDGITDAETRGTVAAFAAYTGFVRRETVVAQADFVIESFSALQSLVLPRV